MFSKDFLLDVLKQGLGAVLALVLIFWLMKSIDAKVDAQTVAMTAHMAAMTTLQGDAARANDERRAQMQETIDILRLMCSQNALRAHSVEDANACGFATRIK